MRYELDRFISLYPNPAESDIKQWSPKVRTALADPRIEGHYGYADMGKTAKMPYEHLRGHAEVLKTWIERWLRIRS